MSSGVITWHQGSQVRSQQEVETFPEIKFYSAHNIVGGSLGILPKTQASITNFSSKWRCNKNVSLILVNFILKEQIEDIITGWTEVLESLYWSQKYMTLMILLFELVKWNTKELKVCDVTWLQVTSTGLSLFCSIVCI